MRHPERDLVHIPLVRELRMAGVYFLHPPNEGDVTVGYRRLLNALGLLPGAPDLLIFDRPSRMPQYHGAALELKSEMGRLNPKQSDVLRHLAARGWAAACTRGYEASRAQLVAWGYLPSLMTP